ncbi:uncharacterized protein [Montipora foliosa]|uniref:uncharacterized protein isoform X2 n=1 Tax=Montipora foliosa TaxID=591990 RepID=UPI0035F17ED7
MKRKELLLMTFVMLQIVSKLQGCPVNFTVEVTDFDNVFDEKIDIDIKKKTVTFHVPQSGDLVEAEIINDFRKNLTMTVLPEQQKCYLSTLDPDLLSPRKLIRAFNRRKFVCIDSANAKSVNVTMVTGERFQRRSRLPRAMKKACRKLPIFHAEEVKVPSFTTSGDLHRRSCTGDVCNEYLICSNECPGDCSKCKRTETCPEACA